MVSFLAFTHKALLSLVCGVLVENMTSGGPSGLLMLHGMFFPPFAQTFKEISHQFSYFPYVQGGSWQSHALQTF